MNRFEKVSYEQYLSSTDGENTIYARGNYDAIKIPVRATTGSAGHDFFAPYDFTLGVGETIKIPSGIRVQLDPDKVLLCCPRSGLGFKYRMQLDNTLGVIDSDYYFSDNEGHIFFKLTNDGREKKTIKIKQGEAFAQGIIVQYFTTVDDNVSEVRNGGFGSTGRK
ncbi:MAG: deoxyuridine 5'-triphosphate nucleotidohydrolase [Oscillospiraceae bacterium]